ncbi:MAG: efflux RND transporter periplasmic adaptor subunit [Deltaproteobacteria bacterium]|nr:efflux RND transporter periplasmic adaptor subunit [Deltaproteobacteria bacterium]MBI3390476.1 efflux RND transporter periplasmic adaptor subunit [Deltaproteobacteria bacterium]
MRRRIVVAIVLIVVAGATLGWWRWQTVRDGNHKAIRGTGIIEVTQVDVAFEVPGRMIERSADEGVMLDKGEPVARLDDHEYRLHVERATAAKAAADAHYRMLVKGSRAQDIDQALAALESAESTLLLQQREQKRLAKLAADGVVSQGELDRINSALDTAQAARDRARAQLNMLREGFRLEEIEQARAQLQQASKELELAELNLARCQLYSPAAGRVLSKSREAGEMVQPGTPVVTLGDLTRPWLNVYVGERDLGKVWLGMKARVTVDSFPHDPFSGKVTFISERAEFTPKNIQTPDERVKLVYRVKVDVETRDQALKPGMPADAELPLEP